MEEKGTGDWLAKSCSMSICLSSVEKYPSPRARYADGRIFQFAAGEALEGSMSLLLWARGLGCPFVTREPSSLPFSRDIRNVSVHYAVCASAARRGHLEVLKWARANNCAWDATTFNQGARGGHLEVLKWARKQLCPLDVASVIELAARGGHLHVLEWVDEVDHIWRYHSYHQQLYCAAAALGVTLKC